MSGLDIIRWFIADVHLNLHCRCNAETFSNSNQAVELRKDCVSRDWVVDSPHEWSSMNTITSDRIDNEADAEGGELVEILPT